MPRARPEAEFERTFVDTEFERTEPEVAAGAPLQEVSLPTEAPPPPAAPPRLPLEPEAGTEAVADSRRYVAVVSEVPGVEVFAERDRGPSAPPAAARGKDHYVTDIPIAVVCAVLAASTFLPWYKGPPGFGIHATGWASGTWGPVIAFLAAGSVVLVALRRLGVRVGLPIEESLVHEAAGWISLVGAVLMSRLRPGQEGLLTAAYGVWIAIAAAAVLIVLAGRMSPHAPLHIRPGWHKERAGVIGIVLLGIIVAGSAVFGVTNSPTLRATGGPSDPLTGSVQGKIPDCAKGFPLPSGIKPQYGFGTGSTCQAQMTSTKTTKVLTDEFRALLKAKGWVFTEDQRQPGVWIFAITKPRCGTLAVVPAESGSIAAVGFTACGTSTPTPRSTRSP